MPQSVKPKYPAEIKAASTRIAERNEDCRRPAREQHLHLLTLPVHARLQAEARRKRAALRFVLEMLHFVLETSALPYTLF